VLLLADHQEAQTQLRFLLRIATGDLICDDLAPTCTLALRAVKSWDMKFPNMLRFVINIDTMCKFSYISWRVDLIFFL
jgi:hypothetical protein